MIYAVYTVVDTFFILLSVYIYTRPLHHVSEKKWKRCILVAAPFLLALDSSKEALLIADYSVFWIVMLEAAATILLSAAIARGCSLGRMSAVYVAIWAVLTAEALQGISLLTERLPFMGRDEKPLLFLVFRILITGSMLDLIGRTAARIMPSDATYRIGPRQFTSALTLGLVFSGCYSMMVVNEWMWTLPEFYIIILFLVQFYCVTLLYVQTELFKKSEMKKEMAAVNAMLYRRKQQYDLARQNVQLINRRCHELKRLVGELEKNGGVSEKSTAVLRQVEEAANIYDAVVKTGNDVLDTVLTDKSLLCESRGIKISCVADGPALSFMEAIDVYTVFNNILDMSMDNVTNFADKEKRSIDILIYRRQKFLIINIMHPMFGTVVFRNGLPAPRNRSEEFTSFDLKAVRQVLRRYDGLLNCEERNGIFTYRIVIPVA